MMNRIRKWSMLLLCLLLCGVWCVGTWTVSAETDINLLPEDVSAYSAGMPEKETLGGDFTVENGVLTIHSTGDEGYRVHIVIDRRVSLADALSIFTKVSCNVPFNVALVIENDEGNPTWLGFAGDFCNRFSDLSNQLAIEPGEYERELDFSDACSFNVHIPDDECLVQEVQIAMKEPDGTMTLSELRLSDSVSPTPVIGEEDDGDDTPATTKPAGSTTTTTAASASGKTDGNPGWIHLVWIMVGAAAAVIVVVLVIVLVVKNKRKA